MNCGRHSWRQQTLHRRAHTGDPLYGIRRIARTCPQLRSFRQYARLSTIFAAEEHVAVKLAWVIGRTVWHDYLNIEVPDR